MTTTAETDGAMWKALANDHRRRILDLLRAGPATTGEVAAHLDGLSRYAVMQHLGVLSDAGLVLVRRRGRERFNHLNAVPLRQAYERWVSRFADDDARQLTALQRHIETTDQPELGETMTNTTDATTDAPAAETEQVRILRLESELKFRCSDERLFRAMTVDTTEWFPYTYGEDRTQRVVMEQKVGGLVYEDWGGDAGHLYGQITEWDPPRVCGMRTRLHAGTIMDTRFEIEPDGDHAVLRSSRVVVGPLTDEHIAGIRFHGDMDRFEDAIRAVVEAA